MSSPGGYVFARRYGSRCLTRFSLPARPALARRPAKTETFGLMLALDGTWRQMALEGTESRSFSQHSSAVFFALRNGHAAIPGKPDNPPFMLARGRPKIYNSSSLPSARR